MYDCESREDAYPWDKLKCSALAFHKALIGITQLDALERAGAEGRFSSFRSSRAVWTYYVVYNLMTSAFLLSPYSSECKPPPGYGKVKDSELNSELETPKQWDLSSKVEQDWATQITHTRLKKFCQTLRSDSAFVEKAPYLKPLFDAFVVDYGSDSRCVPGLFEKLCYVRDRMIYRPSHVLTIDSDVPIQTSKDVRAEVDSLPRAAQLYQAAADTYMKILEESERERQRGEKRRVCSMMTVAMWEEMVGDDDDALCAMGHDRDLLQRLKDRFMEEEEAYPTYICQLLELENDTALILSYQETLWRPLEEAYNQSWERWRSRKKPN